jgi:hypothetical protein
MEDAAQSLETIRKRIEHEDNLLNQRLSWIVSSQAFLLTGDLTLNVRAETSSPRHDRVYTVTVETRDAAGNASRKAVKVIVTARHSTA